MFFFNADIIPVPTPMNKDDDGIWRVSLNLNYGDYAYKFMADGNWAIDEYNN